MIKTVFKAHPLMIFRLIKPYLFVLVLPIVRAIIQYFSFGEADGLLAVEVIILMCIVFIAIFGWRAISITVNNEVISIKKGVFIKTCAVIDLSKISSIALKQNIFDVFLNCISCEINTEAGTPKKSDFSIKLFKKDAKCLYNMVYSEKNMKLVRFSPLRIALLSATVSSAATGIILGVPVMNQVGDLLGIAISDMLIDEISNVSVRFNSIFPPVVNTITIILLISYGISFVMCFAKHINFKLKSGINSIEIQSGIITRRKTAFKKSMVNDICFEQTPLMRIIKKYSMRVSIGGYGNGKGEKAIIVPVAEHSELKEQLKEHFPFLTAEGKNITTTHNAFNLNRFLYIPTILSFLIISFCIGLIIAFPLFDRLILFLSVVALCVNFYYGSICYHGYKQGKIKIGKYILATGSSGLIVRELYCDKNKVGVIKLTQTPADKHLKTCKVRVVVRSEVANSVKIKNLNIEEVKKILKRGFNLRIDE